VRGALWVDQPFGEGDDGALVVVANSPLPCRADTEDDPATAPDEAAEAKAWWALTVEAALTREGAVVFALLVDDADGEQAIGGEDSPWLGLRIYESRWGDEGPEVLRYEAVQTGRGEATVSRSDTTVRVSASVEGYTAVVEAERCDNARLSSAVVEVLASF